MTKTPIVGVILDTTTSWNRGVLLGISRFSRTVEHWHLRRLTTASLPEWLVETKETPRGVVGQFHATSTSTLAALERVPTITVSNRAPPKGIPLVTSDDELIGRQAAAHLLECGFRRFGFAGFSGHRYSRLRGRGFRKKLVEAGFDCAAIGHEDGGQDDYAALKCWLESLTKPVGIFACNDIRATHISDICETHDWEIPDQLAIVGVDDDVVLCEFAPVPLTSIAPNFEQVGYEAAALLRDMLQGKPAPFKPVLVPPHGITARQSTEVEAVDDPLVRRALAIIRQHACDPIQIADVVRQIPLSRRPLEIRFLKATGRTLHDEIRRVQLERAKKMLAGSDMKIVDIALTVGFSDPTRFAGEFRRRVGELPSEYRSRNQA
jgi:LacI family transcriptional regulator